MKGIVYTIIQQMVEEKLGLEVWDRMLSDLDLASEGIYTASATYDDEELTSIVGWLSRETGQAPQDLVRGAGEYSLGVFVERFPGFFDTPSAKDFLKSIHDVIHVEVRKLYPDAEPPSFEYEDLSPDTLTIIYRSRRQLCAFAEGLIDGTGLHFGESISRTKTKCVHDGDDHCRYELTFGKKP